VQVTFSLPVDAPPGAVSVAGPFNDWTPGATPLKKSLRHGDRRATVTVGPGERVPFRYVVDGERWFDDDAADDWQDNAHGGTDGIVCT
jgi:hypothetical protein